MAAPKVTVTVGDGLIKRASFAQVVNQQFVDKIGPLVVSEMKKLIASGRSPVKGFGRFEPYKNPEKYPGDLKPHRPVNLSLTGTMLSYLSFRKSANNRLEIGILPEAPQKVKVIARVHNTGERSDIAKRQFIPEDGEEFVPQIQNMIRDFFKKRVLEVLKG